MERSTLASCLLVLLLFMSNSFVPSQNVDVDGGLGPELGGAWVRVGLVLDLDSLEGKMVATSVSLALSDFYAINSDYKTRVSLCARNSHGKPLLALASAVELLQIVKVEAIIGGHSFLETTLLAEIGEKARVPVISFSSPISSSYTHLIQATHDSISEAKGIAAFISGFDWTNVALLYEDDDCWRDTMYILVDQFHENDIQTQSKVSFTVSSSEDFIIDRLQKMKDSGTIVFVVHLSESIATRLFSCAEKLGMMSERFAWILTVKSMNSFVFDDNDFAKEVMEGVIGFKSYIPMSRELQIFTMRCRKSLSVEGEEEIIRLSMSSLLAHDIAWALARAVEVASLPNVSLTLLEVIMETSFNGFTGDFKLNDKKMKLSNKFEIVNIIGSGERRIGFWNSNGSFSNRRHLSSTHDNLETIIWPGGGFAPSSKGRNLEERKRKKLRVLVTSSNRFPRLMKVETNNQTNITTADGFCIEVFLASISPFDYDVEYIPWLGGTNYDNLAYKLNEQKAEYDVAVGDITITSNRSIYVDFTIPFTEMGLGIVAPKERSMWVFFQPLTTDLWITSAAFFILTGVIVWLIERPENPEFQGSWSKQIGVVFWFGFSTLVYAHRERLKHNLSRFVVTVWVFAVLILTASYTATLTSMMTVQQIRFNSNEDYVGHLSGSLIANVALTSSSLREMRSLGLNSSKDYAQALLNKTVSFIVDELTYLKVLLGENPANFQMVKTQCTTNGFGFMFQKGNELVHNVSREISKLRTSERLIEMEKRWFEKELPYTTDDTSNPITLYRFRGLFMITGVSFAFALALLLIIRLQHKWEGLIDSIKIFLTRRLFARTIHPSPLDENANQTAQHIRLT